MKIHGLQRKKKIKQFFTKKLNEEAQVKDIQILFDAKTQTEEILFNQFIKSYPQQAFACLIEGIGYSQFQRLCIFINIDPPPHNQFSKA